MAGFPCTAGEDRSRGGGGGEVADHNCVGCVGRKLRRGGAAPTRWTRCDGGSV